MPTKIYITVRPYFVQNKYVPHTKNRPPPPQQTNNVPVDALHILELELKRFEQVVCFVSCADKHKWITESTFVFFQNMTLTNTWIGFWRFKTLCNDYPKSFATDFINFYQTRFDVHGHP
jgi:hypothetical protein